VSGDSSNLPSFRPATCEQIYPLRDAVLIANTNRDSPVFDGDDRSLQRFTLARLMGAAASAA
jgi:hypothetical protein